MCSRAIKVFGGVERAILMPFGGGGAARVHAPLVPRLPESPRMGGVTQSLPFDGAHTSPISPGIFAELNASGGLRAHGPSAAAPLTADCTSSDASRPAPLALVDTAMGAAPSAAVATPLVSIPDFAALSKQGLRPFVKAMLDFAAAVKRVVLERLAAGDVPTALARSLRALLPAAQQAMINSVPTSTDATELLLEDNHAALNVMMEDLYHLGQIAAALEQYDVADAKAHAAPYGRRLLDLFYRLMVRHASRIGFLPIVLPRDIELAPSVNPEDFVDLIDTILHALRTTPPGTPPHASAMAIVLWQPPMTFVIQGSHDFDQKTVEVQARLAAQAERIGAVLTVTEELMLVTCPINSAHYDVTDERLFPWPLSPRILTQCAVDFQPKARVLLQELAQWESAVAAGSHVIDRDELHVRSEIMARALSRLQAQVSRIPLRRKTRLVSAVLEPTLAAMARQLAAWTQRLNEPSGEVRASPTFHIAALRGDPHALQSPVRTMQGHADQAQRLLSRLHLDDETMGDFTRLWDAAIARATLETLASLHLPPIEELTQLTTETTIQVDLGGYVIAIPTFGYPILADLLNLAWRHGHVTTSRGALVIYLPYHVEAGLAGWPFDQQSLATAADLLQCRCTTRPQRTAYKITLRPYQGLRWR